MGEEAERCFLSWLRGNGAELDNIAWPSLFGGVRGAMATKDIGSQQPIISIPQKLMMTPAKARKLPDIGHVFIEQVMWTIRLPTTSHAVQVKLLFLG
ncbi:unnamed protein product [Chrysoparadoxa australica]